MKSTSADDSSESKTDDPIEKNFFPIIAGSTAVYIIIILIWYRMSIKGSGEPIKRHKLFLFFCVIIVFFDLGGAGLAFGAGNKKTGAIMAGLPLAVMIIAFISYIISKVNPLTLFLITR